MKQRFGRSHSGCQSPISVQPPDSPQVCASFAWDLVVEAQREDRRSPTLSMAPAGCQKPYLDSQLKHRAEGQRMKVTTAARENIRKEEIWSRQATAGSSDQKHGDAQFVAHETTERLSTWRLKEMQREPLEGNHISAGHEQANNDFHFICVCTKHTWHYFRGWGQKFDEYRSLLKALCSQRHLDACYRRIRARFTLPLTPALSWDVFPAEIHYTTAYNTYTPLSCQQKTPTPHS